MDSTCDLLRDRLDVFKSFFNHEPYWRAHLRMRSFGGSGHDLGDGVSCHQLAQHLSPQHLGALEGSECYLLRPIPKKFPACAFFGAWCHPQLMCCKHALGMSFRRAMFSRIVWFPIDIHSHCPSFPSTLDLDRWWKTASFPAQTLFVRSSAATIHLTSNFKICVRGI